MDEAVKQLVVFYFQRRPEVQSFYAACPDPSEQQKPTVWPKRHKICDQHHVAMASATLLAACRSQCADRWSGALPETWRTDYCRGDSGQPRVVVPRSDTPSELRGRASDSRLPAGSRSDPAGAHESGLDAGCRDGELLRMARVYGVHVEPCLTANLTATRADWGCFARSTVAPIELGSTRADGGSATDLLRERRPEVEHIH